MQSNLIRNLNLLAIQHTTPQILTSAKSTLRDLASDTNDRNCFKQRNIYLRVFCISSATSKTKPWRESTNLNHSIFVKHRFNSPRSKPDAIESNCDSLSSTVSFSNCSRLPNCLALIRRLVCGLWFVVWFVVCGGLWAFVSVRLKATITSPNTPKKQNKTKQNKQKNKTRT